MKNPDGVKSENLRREAERARAAADQHLKYAAQALSIGSSPLKQAHDGCAEAYMNLAKALDERADYFAESVKAFHG